MVKLLGHTAVVLFVLFSAISVLCENEKKPKGDLDHLLLGKERSHLAVLLSVVDDVVLVNFLGQKLKTLLKNREYPALILIL